MPLSVVLISAAQTVRSSAAAGTTYDANVKELFKSISPNFRRKIRFLDLQDVAISASPTSGVGSEAQKAFSQLIIRWFEFLKLPGFKEHPVIPVYRLTPRLTIDECVDRMLSSQIRFPTWEDIGNKEATVEEIMPAFYSFVRHLASLERLRSRYVERIRAYVSHVGYKIAMGVQPDQFDKSLFLAYCDPKGEGASKYLDNGSPIPLVENSNPLVLETISLLKSSVEAGPFLRFGILNSNKLLNELFAFFGPFVPSLEYHYGYGQKIGPYLLLKYEEKEIVEWNLAEQEDAIRDAAEVVVVQGSSIINAMPFIAMRPYRASIGNKADGLFAASLDVPEVSLRMASGFKSWAHDWIAEWYSPLRGRNVSTEFGYDADTLMEDLALKNERLGEGQIESASLATWSLFDEQALLALATEDALSKITLETDFTERIIYRDAAGKFREATIDLAPLYTTKGVVSVRPAFSEFVAVHRNQLLKEDPTAEQFIANRLNLTRTARRGSEPLIRQSHRWNVLKRLFGLEVMPWDKLKSLLELTYGSVKQEELLQPPPRGISGLEDFSGQKGNKNT